MYGCLMSVNIGSGSARRSATPGNFGRRDADQAAPFNTATRWAEILAFVAACCTIQELDLLGVLPDAVVIFSISDLVCDGW